LFSYLQKHTALMNVAHRSVIDTVQVHYTYAYIRTFCMMDASLLQVLYALAVCSIQTKIKVQAEQDTIRS
jgi:hypothetical protein